MQSETSPSLSRRRLAAGTVSLCCLTLLPSHARGKTPSLAAGDFLMPIEGKSGACLTESQIRNSNTAIMCWPVSAQTRQPRMETPYNRLWVMRTHAGFRGYSVICQHAGCLVSDWDSATHRLTCPCHGSVYDVEHDGAVVGGPAPLPLPFAMIAVRDGYLRVASNFSAKVGGHASRAD